MVMKFMVAENGGQWSKSYFFSDVMIDGLMMGMCGHYWFIDG